MRISFGPFAFDRQSRLLWREGAEVALPPRVLGVLEILIDRPGQVVARQDLMDGVWKDAFVTDTSLAEAVSFLRQALGDDPQSPRYIQTVHRRGYRFLAPLSEERGLTPDLTRGGPSGGLTPENRFVMASGDRLVSATPVPGREWELLPWGVAVLCTLLIGALAWRSIDTPAPELPVAARFEVSPADGTSFARSDRHIPALAVSADGRTLAWSACDDRSGGCALYLRPIDRLDAVMLPGTEDASSPFFSPDGRWVGFFANGKLKKIAASGGSPTVLADAPSPGGASWGRDGRIVFNGAPAAGLSLVSDQGGPVSALTTPNSRRAELRHLLPAWLPGGGVVFTVATSPVADAPGTLAVMARDGTTWRTLRGGVTSAQAPNPGYLLIASGDDVQAATFDERSLTLTSGGESMLASITGRGGLSEFAVASSGTLAGLGTPAAGRTFWSDRPGENAGSLGRLSSIAISPDGKRAAGVIADASGSDIWVADLTSDALTRLTYGGTNASPAWSADGRQIYFASRATGPFTLSTRRVDDRAEVPVAAPLSQVFPTSTAADGRIALTMLQSTGATPAHSVVAILAPNQESPRVLTDGPFDEAGAVFSPDGEWLAVESDESGRTEVIVRDLRDGRRVPISADGGVHPNWSADGRTLYFESGRRMMRAAFDAARDPHLQHAEAVVDRAGVRVLAVTPTGRVLLREQSSPSSAIVILQWLRELRQRMPLPVTAP